MSFLRIYFNRTKYDTFWTGLLSPSSFLRGAEKIKKDNRVAVENMAIIGLHLPFTKKINLCLFDFTIAFGKSTYNYDLDDEKSKENFFHLIASNKFMSYSSDRKNATFNKIFFITSFW